MKKILTLLILFLLISCHKESIETSHKGDFKVELLFEHDGCKVYRFFDARYVYYTDCSCGSSTVTTYQKNKNEIENVEVNTSY